MEATTRLTRDDTAMKEYTIEIPYYERTYVRLKVQAENELEARTKAFQMSEDEEHWESDPDGNYYGDPIVLGEE